MKKNFSLIILVTLISVMGISCGKKDKDAKDQDAVISEIIAESEAALPNYRYVDIDTILSKYNLAKDYNEEMLRMQNNLEAEMKRQQNNLQSFAATVDKKRQNNGYLTEASFNADMQQLNDMQNKAQRSVAALQSNFENTALQAQKTVNDSIEAYIQSYNLQKGYDAIFIKSATLFINPSLDITNEVIEGLNARYNKVK